MLTETPLETTSLRLASPNGLVTREILQTPLRDALPSEIPLIDIAELVSGSSTLEQRKEIAAQIRCAATNTGFFYIVNHGVPLEVTDASNHAAREFFRQDLATKSRATSDGTGFHNGYRAPNTQIINPTEGVDIREAFSLRYDPRWDPLVRDQNAIPQHVRDGFGYDEDAFANTANCPAFGEALRVHFQAGLRLARTLTRAFALSLGLPEDAFDQKSEYPGCAMGVNYYPPIQGAETVVESADASTRVSIGSHTDFQLFTILWQDDTGGLQVLNREGQWIRARPVRGSFIVNIADFMQRITNDLYISTVHRAQNWSDRERVSIAFFWGFGLHESCGVLETCLAADEEPKYAEISCRDWVKKRLKDMQKLKSKE
ncbi:hypothetical protein NQ176_g633 [Zarea fungicola]|uniref:Uncharacterized protein n=1 Tax=Zarea fungicola TaxID=93591 RepID=A0ACC1NX92_9HYPO|nr:hypothetical protein NQ176_g633 [Lecanicillium fungicola]